MTARGGKGFTLVELLTVIAIIGSLVAVSIPVFSGMTEKAQAAVDESNVRTAKSLAAAQYMTEGTTGQVRYYFDAASGTVKSAQSGIQGYGKSSVAVTGAEGIPNPGGSSPNVLTVMISNGGSTIEAAWGVRANRSILNATSVGDASDDDRVAQDESLLNALQAEIQKLTVSELAAMIGGSDLNSKDFILGVTRAVAAGQQTTYDGYQLYEQYINSGFTSLFETVGVNVQRVNAKDDYLLVTPGSGNDVRIKVNIGTINGKKNMDLSWYFENCPDAKLSSAYVYLDAQDDQDKKFASLYTNERAKTVQ